MAPTPSVDRALELGRRLADAGEDDVGRLEARAQGDFDLAAGVGVGAGAKPLQAPHHAERGVGLDRVVEPVRNAGKRRIERAEALVDERAAVDVHGRARPAAHIVARSTPSQVSTPCSRKNPVTGPVIVLPVGAGSASRATRGLL